MRAPLDRLTAVLGVAVILAVLTGCAPGDPKPSPAVSLPVATPAFASDEEALAAAEKAYAAYLAVDDVVLNQGGSHSERYDAVASGDALSSALSNAAKFRSQDVHTTGSSAFVTEKLQAVLETSSGVAVAIYVCDDVAGVDLLDASGKSIVSPNRVPVAPFVITMERAGGSDLISRRDLWTTENFCK